MDQNEVDLAELDEDEFQQWLQNKYPGRTVRREGDEIVVSIPVKFYRRNGRQMVLNEYDVASKESKGETNGSLVAALAKAYLWQEQLESGEYGSIEELASSNGVSRTYAGRFLQLTSLSPEIIEAILRGDEPEGISLAKLRNNLPVLWAEQKWQ